MERRKFFKVFPVGVLGIAALATGTNQNSPKIVKTKHVTLQTDDGEYNVLAVKKDTEMDTVDRPVTNF